MVHGTDLLCLGEAYDRSFVILPFGAGFQKLNLLHVFQRVKAIPTNSDTESVLLSPYDSPDTPGLLLMVVAASVTQFSSPLEAVPYP